MVGVASEQDWDSPLLGLAARGEAAMLRRTRRGARVGRWAFTLADATIALLILAGLVLIGGLAVRSLNSSTPAQGASAAAAPGEVGQ